MPISARTQARRHSLVLVVIAVGVGVVASLATSWWRGPAYGWGAAALVYNIMVWSSIARMDATRTQDHAESEEPSKQSRRLLVNLSTLASLGTVGMLLVDSSKSDPLPAGIDAVLALLNIAVSWLLITTVFTLRSTTATSRWAALISIRTSHRSTPILPYLAFSLGMTYQVSDTSITQTEMRTTALIHSIYAFIFGIAVTATSINLVISLAQG